MKPLPEADTSSSGEDCASDERIDEKHTQDTIRQYRRKIFMLEENAQKRELHIQDLRRMRDKLKGELRRLENGNRGLKKQLSEERKQYAMEKENFYAETLEYKRSMARKQKHCQGGNNANEGNRREIVGKFTSDTINYAESRISQNFSIFSEITSLRTENEQLRSIVEKSDEKNYELCVRFLRMKRSKDMIWKRLQELDDEFLQVMKNFMEKFDEVREEYNLLVNDSYRTPSNCKYMEMAQNNSNLIYENAYLKMELQCLKKDINAQIFGPRQQKSRYGKKSKKKTREVSCSTDDLPVEDWNISKSPIIEISMVPEEPSPEPDTVKQERSLEQQFSVVSNMKRSQSDPSLPLQENYPIIVKENISN